MLTNVVWVVLGSRVQAVAKSDSAATGSTATGSPEAPAAGAPPALPAETTTEIEQAPLSATATSQAPSNSAAEYVS